MCFPTPLRAWLRAELYDWASHILDTYDPDGVLDLGYGRQLLEEQRRGEADNTRKVWTILVFCIWYAIFVTGELDPGAQGGARRPLPGSGEGLRRAA